MLIVYIFILFVQFCMNEFSLDHLFKCYGPIVLLSTIVSFFGAYCLNTWNPFVELSDIYFVLFQVLFTSTLLVISQCSLSPTPPPPEPLSLENNPAPYRPTPPPPHYGPSPTPHYAPPPAPYAPHIPHHPSPVYGYSPAPPPYGAPPQYGYTPSPAYGYQPHAPVHHPAAPRHPPPSHHAKPHHEGPPACSKNTTKVWCLEDSEYPAYEISHAIEYNYAGVAALYKDVLANTENSVDRLVELPQETYLCPSETGYLMPLRAVNTANKWRIVVNGVKAHYETLTQTARVEECTTAGEACPLVPACYETKCVQKSIYHR